MNKQTKIIKLSILYLLGTFRVASIAPYFLPVVTYSHLNLELAHFRLLLFRLLVIAVVFQ